MDHTKENRIALLIDGDNAQAKFIENMLAEAGKHGKVTIRRIYGDWTENRLNSWKDVLSKYSIRPVQKFAFAKGKNSTDTAMIIDAMDILHSKAVTGFCLASSDSDYTGLAQRIREDGVLVIGVGEAKITAEAFVNACDIFVFTEIFKPILKDAENKGAQSKAKLKVLQPPKNPSARDLENKQNDESSELPRNKITNQYIDLNYLNNAFEMVADENGRAHLGGMGSALRKIDPSFDSRTYGFSSLSSLFKRLPNHFEMVPQENGSSPYIRLKKKAI